MKQQWMSLTIEEMKQIIERGSNEKFSPPYLQIRLGYTIVTTPEFTFKEIDGTSYKIPQLTPEEIKFRRSYYRNRQNGSARKAIPMQMIIESLKDHAMMWDVRKDREAEHKDKYISNMDKLYLLDPENQDF